MTTIEPDEETINTLIDAVDTAVTSLQNAVGGTTTPDTSFNYDYFDNYNYDLGNVNAPDLDLPPDYFTGNEDYFSNLDYEEEYESIDYTEGEEITISFQS